MTQILRASNSRAIRDAAALIRQGELVAFPTETVYGLGANAFNKDAVARIFITKGRPPTDPLIVHIAHIAQLDAIAEDVPELAKRLIAVFWPGPLTVIVPRRAAIPANVSAGLSTVAVRMPAHPIARALIDAARVPIAAPSANRFAHTSPTTAQHVYDDLAGRIPLILDGGSTTIGLELTIVDVSGEHARLLRPGGVSLESLQNVLPDIEVISRYAEPADGAQPAPGMLLRHYSPRAELRLFEGDPAAVRAALRAEALTLRTAGKRVGLLIADEDRAPLADIDIPQIAPGSLNDLDQVAWGLFAGLRALDAENVEIILARTYPPEGVGLAIRDRLLRAAEGNITQAL